MGRLKTEVWLSPHSVQFCSGSATNTFANTCPSSPERKERRGGRSHLMCVVSGSPHLSKSKPGTQEAPSTTGDFLWTRWADCLVITGKVNRQPATQPFRGWDVLPRLPEPLGSRREPPFSHKTVPVSLVHQSLEAYLPLEGSVLLQARKLRQFHQILHKRCKKKTHEEETPG